MDLVMGELLGGCEVLKLLVIGQHECDVCWPLQVVVPLSEGLKDSQQLLVIDLIVELSGMHAMGVEDNCVYVTIVRGDLGDYFCDHTVRSISFNNNGIIRVEMCQDGCLGGGSFEGLEHHG